MAIQLHLRAAAAADLPAMARADPRLRADAALGAHLAELMSDGMSWLALSDDAPVGYAIVTRRFFGFPFVDLLVVDETRRRGGVGTALMAQAERAHDRDRIFTSTNESNTPMRALLDKAGWRPAGVVHYLDPGDPELMFVRLRDPA